jgi:hypothetical protein
VTEEGKNSLFHFSAVLMLKMEASSFFEGMVIIYFVLEESSIETSISV